MRVRGRVGVGTCALYVAPTMVDRKRDERRGMESGVGNARGMQMNV